jgi:hypothetical protein
MTSHPIVHLRDEDAPYALIAPRRVREHDDHHEKDNHDDRNDSHESTRSAGETALVDRGRLGTPRGGHRWRGGQKACPIAKWTTSRRPIDRHAPGDGSMGE